MLEVRSPGALTTVQDGLGRPDAAALGVPRAGAADPDGLAVANLLLGNAATDAALELTLSGPDLVALETCAIAIGGADLGATVEPGGGRLRPGAVYRLARGSVLTFAGGRPGTGIRAYVALPGGVDVPAVLGSASTCLPGGFGGVDGRPLRAGDRIAGRRREPSRRAAVWPRRPASLPPPGGAVVRVVAGPHASDDDIDALVASPWDVSATSDRSGVRLAGRSVGGGRGELTSLPMSWGCVQLPPSGEPIVLLVDGPTVGGYPVVAVVAATDRGLVGQLGPGDRLRFVRVSAEEARAAELARRRDLVVAAAELAADEGWQHLDDEAGAWPPGSL